MSYFPSPEDPPDAVDLVVMFVSGIVAWFAAVGIQSHAYSLRWEHEMLVQSGAVPNGSGPPFAALYALSMVVGIAIPLLAMVGRRWLWPASARRNRRLRSPAPELEGKAHVQLQSRQPAPPRTDLTPEIDVGAREASALTCPYCKSEFADAEDLVRCPSCAAQQHSECLAEHGRCAVCGQSDDFERLRARA